MQAAFATSTGVDLVERYPGTGSTDFWGSRSRFRASTSTPWRTTPWRVS